MQHDRSLTDLHCGWLRIFTGNPYPPLRIIPTQRRRF
jgi:hypothetical protein